jgi:DNA-binding LacI/PurR family transcriptional regulator
VRGLGTAGIRFDAIVCASDSLGLGALLLVDSGIPVIGYDNTPVAEAVGLSSVEQPLEEVAAGALELIMGTTGSELVDWEQSDASRHRLVTPRLISRHRRIN